MKIKSMTATFGRLNRARLELGPGFNLIHAPNEGGKSTWAAFLKAMLYGVDTRDRDRKGHLADKNRYQPWSGTPMEGELVLEWRGRDITLRRGARGNNPFGGFSAVYTGTEEPVPGLTADTCGEFLLGAGRELYERSAFLGQEGSLTITSAPELERRIAALVSSGEEDVSYSQAEKRLKEWLNRRRVNKSVGRIPQLEGELARAEAELAEAERLNGELNRLAAERSGLARRREKLTAELEAHKALARQALNRKFAQAEAELEEAKAQMGTLERERARFKTIPDHESLKRAQGELAFLKALDPEIKRGEEELIRAEARLEEARTQAEDERFPGMTGEEAAAAVRQTQADHAKALKNAGVWRVWAKLIPAIGAVCSAIMAGLYLTEGNALDLARLLLRLAPLALGIGFGLIAHNLVRREQARGERLLSRYSVRTSEELNEILEDYRTRCQDADQAAQALRMVRSGLEERRARRENSREGLFQFVHSFAPEVTDLFGCSAALSLALSLGEKESVARARLEGAQRLHNALKAQGGRLEPEPEAIAAPECPLEETAAQLGVTQAELERADRALNMALGRQKATGDPAALAARAEELRTELERRNREYQAISAAMEVLKGANAQLQERFSPELNRRAGELLSRLTGGKYTALSLNRELEASAGEASGVLPRRSLYLSRGTVDQVYLAVRLAVYSLCLKEEKVPLVLDDALAAFDDSRMGLALDLLLELSREEQILFFTCQDREGLWLAEHSESEVRRIELPRGSSE